MKKYLLLLLIPCLLFSLSSSQEAWAAVTFNASSSSNTNAATSLTYALTVATSSNLGLVVNVSVNSSMLDASTTVTYAGAAMSRLAVASNTAAFTGKFWQFGLINPATGANNVVVTLATSTNHEIISNAMSVSGANQTTLLTASSTAFNSSTTVKTTVTTTANDLIIDLESAPFAHTTTVGAGQTKNLNEINGTSGLSLNSSRQAGSVDGVMSWTIDTLDDWSIMAVSIKAAAAAVVAPNTSTTLLISGASITIQ